MTFTYGAAPTLLHSPDQGAQSLRGKFSAVGLYLPVVRTIILLTISNIFMTFAWYGHLKFRETPLWIAIVVSWMIAFVEYCFQVPANRIGSYQFSTAQLKTIQEVITLVVFSIFSVTYLRDQFRWNYVVAFGFIVGAVFFMFYE